MRGVGLFGTRGTPEFARSADWRTEADRIRAEIAAPPLNLGGNFTEKQWALDNVKMFRPDPLAEGVGIGEQGRDRGERGGEGARPARIR